MNLYLYFAAKMPALCQCQSMYSHFGGRENDRDKEKVCVCSQPEVIVRHILVSVAHAYVHAVLFLFLSLSLSLSFPRITLTNFSDNSIPLMKGTIHLLPYRTIRTLLHQHRVELL